MASNPLTDPNWAKETTDQVVQLVSNVREKTTVPVVKIARGLVFGVLAAFLGFFAFMALLIGVTRALQALLDLGMSAPRSVYVSYLILGGIFCLVGLFLFRKRRAEAA